MSVAIIKAAITAALALYGLTPAWCDSCGELYKPEDVHVCETCGAHVCPTCAELHTAYVGPNGCFVCD